MDELGVAKGDVSQIYLVEFKPYYTLYNKGGKFPSQIYLVEFKQGGVPQGFIGYGGPKSTLWNLNFLSPCILLCAMRVPNLPCGI